MKNKFLRICAALAALIVAALPLSAQFRPDTFAITNAKIVTVSGKTIEKGTIVVRNGLIESVGENDKVPADAKIIDGSGMTVYPGFFDTNTSLAIPASTPRPGGQQGAQAQSSNSNYPEGLQPEKRTFDELKANEQAFEAQRNTGITSALTVGNDGIFNGQSAVINLSGDSVSAMVVRSPFAQHITFTTLRGGQYPTSLMGTFSAMRQMFLDTLRHIELKKMYAANPRGMQRPPADASLEALIPVVTGAMPIVFNANTEREIIRSLDLAKEFKLNAMIAGGFEAWKVAERLKAQNVPVLLSLNFPERTTAEAKDADPETLETLRLRVEVPKNAARLKAAGVKFAFQSGGLKNLSKDFIGNIAKAVNAGLSKEDAVRAASLGAAEILGVNDRLGSVEEGKIANLFAVRGDIFDKDKQILHIFVDGNHFENKEKPKSEIKPGGTAPAGTFAQIGGSWNVAIDIPGSPITATYNFIQQGGTFTGTMQTQFGTTNITDGKVTANGFSFAATVEFAGQTFDVFVNGTKVGDRIEGTITSPQGPVTFTGTKNP
ncbi:MAG: amidohydrolase family protein [Pyrinomonadaceae bacterium]|nr:amidohydrolase family protein [Pyrinomonadaceae bacterium]